MTLAFFCLILAPVGWVPSRMIYALRVGQAANLQPHPIDQQLIATLSKQEAVARIPHSSYAFFANGSASGAGAPPPGLDVDASTGALVGVPTMAGTYTVAVGISDGKVGRIVGPVFTVRVLPPI